MHFSHWPSEICRKAIDEPVIFCTLLSVWYTSPHCNAPISPMERSARWGYRMAIFTASFGKNFKKDCTMCFWFQQDLYPTFEPCILVRCTILFHFCIIHFLLLHNACPTSWNIHLYFLGRCRKNVGHFQNYLQRFRKKLQRFLRNLPRFF